MRYLFIFFSLIIFLVTCTKKQGKNPVLAYNDLALLDSSLQNYHSYYKNDASTVLSGAHGPHGAFKLRFNPIAKNALTDNGKLPAGGSFPDGSFIIKDIYSGADISLYAFMYKFSGSWLWGEVKPDKSVVHSVNSNAGICTGCHSQTGNRDFVVSFNFY